MVGRGLADEVVARNGARSCKLTSDARFLVRGLIAASHRHRRRGRLGSIISLRGVATGGGGRRVRIGVQTFNGTCAWSQGKTPRFVSLCSADVAYRVVTGGAGGPS